MYCQKCRTPLKVDGSLEDLNPAAFDLLVGSTGTSLQQHPYSPSRRPYPQGRKDLYDQAAQHAQSPIFKRVVPGPRPAPGGYIAAPDSSKGLARDNPAMSFVMLTESQVVPPPSNHRAHEGSARPGINGRRRDSADYGTEDGEKRSLSHQMETTARLFEVLSSRSDIDYPICVECTELLIDGLQKRLGNTTRERDAYVDFLRKVNAELPTSSELHKAQTDLQSAREAEKAAFAELQQVERQKAAVDAEIADLEREADQLDSEEEVFWRERNAFALTLSEFQNERDGVNLAYDHDARQLERLQRTNVYNDTFCIGHDGFFGTINGLRLGRLANPAVEWAEINAAWGQTLLLLASVAEKLGFAFEGYRLRPMGSTSRIERVEYPTSTSNAAATSSPTRPATTTNSNTANTAQQPPHHHPADKTPVKITSLELYSSGDLPLGRMFLHRRFDNAMVAFLECLRQLGDFVEHAPFSPPAQTSSTPRSSTPTRKQNPNHRRASPSPSPSPGHGHGTATGLKLPYEIKKDRIGDASIRLGLNQDEAWTRACKYTLTCCKFLLAHASNIGGAGRSRDKGGI